MATKKRPQPLRLWPKPSPRIDVADKRRHACRAFFFAVDGVFRKRGYQTLYEGKRRLLVNRNQFAGVRAHVTPFVCVTLTPGDLPGAWCIRLYGFSASREWLGDARAWKKGRPRWGAIARAVARVPGSALVMTLHLRSAELWPFATWLPGWVDAQLFGRSLPAPPRSLLVDNDAVEYLAYTFAAHEAYPRARAVVADDAGVP